MDLPVTKVTNPNLATHAALFAEELGLVMEVSPRHADTVTSLFNQAGVGCSIIGKVTPDKKCEIRVGAQAVVSGDVTALRDVWERTSFALERLQSAEECVDAEQQGLKHRKAPSWRLSYQPEFTPKDKLNASDKVTRAAGFGIGVSGHQNPLNSNLQGYCCFTSGGEKKYSPCKGANVRDSFYLVEGLKDTLYSSL